MSGRLVFTAGAIMRGDDAAGPMLAKMLEDNPVEGWAVLDGGQHPERGLSSIYNMRPDLILIVSTADMCEEPGTIRVLTRDEAAYDYTPACDSVPVSYLTNQLEGCCGKVIHLGIQYAQMNFMEAMNPAVLNAVQTIYNWIAADVETNVAAVPQTPVLATAS